MKKYNIILAFALILFSFIACEKDEDKVYISGEPTVPILQTPASPNGMAFIKDDADEMIEFSWTASDFGYQASITYGLQIALTDDFAGAALLFTTQDLSGSAKVGDINAILLANELIINEEATIKCRVFAMVSQNSDSAFSASVDYTVTPYETLIDYPVVYLPGSYQGWAPDGADVGLLYSYEFNDVYENIMHFTDDAEFKITVEQNWDLNYGGSGGILEQNGPNFIVTAGAYIINADLGNLTYSITATDYWGIIGGSIPPYDWSVDVDMTYNGQRQTWEVTGDFVAGDFKFRANDGWDLNYGDTGADGSLDAGGDNIALAADGNYTITLDTNSKTYIVTKN